ncbi:MAG: Coenzyme F420 hydrogenase/dehydrogenase, beta subunit C-terminal domain [Bacillota bacterium]
MYKLKVEQQNPVRALSEFLKNLLREKVIDALLLPQQREEKVGYTLVTQPEGVIAADPFSPVAYLNAAWLAREVSNRARKTGVLLRACEISALIEMAKLNQAELQNLLIIGIDCVGTYEPAVFQELAASGKFHLPSWLPKAASTGEGDISGARFRTACTICTQIAPENAQISIGWVGLDPREEIAVDSKEELPVEKLSLLPEESFSNREKLINELKAIRTARQEEVCREFRRRVNSPQALRKELSTCIRCYNCRTACPLCICQECIFASPLFQYEPDHYLERADQQTFVEMPADTLLFHLTRLTHVGLSCVGCGHCEAACPSKIPLSILFTATGKKLQELFDYVPGRNPEEKLPLVSYKLNELAPPF